MKFKENYIMKKEIRRKQIILKKIDNHPLTEQIRKIPSSERPFIPFTYVSINRLESLMIKAEAFLYSVFNIFK